MQSWKVWPSRWGRICCTIVLCVLCTGQPCREADLVVSPQLTHNLFCNNKVGGRVRLLTAPDWADGGGGRPRPGQPQHPARAGPRHPRLQRGQATLRPLCPAPRRPPARDRSHLSSSASTTLTQNSFPTQLVTKRCCQARLRSRYPSNRL